MGAGFFRPRDTEKTIAHHLAVTLEAVPRDDQDSAVRELAKHYADVIDNSSGHCRDCADVNCKKSATDAWLARWIFPLMLECLAELGATPAARSRLKKGKPEAPRASKLQALRNSRPA